MTHQRFPRLGALALALGAPFVLAACIGQVKGPELVAPTPRFDALAFFEGESMGLGTLDKLVGKTVTYDTGGLSLKQLLRFISESVKRAPALEEWIDSSLLQKQEWPSWQKAVQAAHKPESPADATPLSSARQRLGYDELLAGQLALSLVRTRQNKRPGRVIKTDNVLEDKIRALLPFHLTASQELSLHEIKTDMASPQRMMRMLQGDVGSGKTVIVSNPNNNFSIPQEKY